MKNMDVDPSPPPPRFNKKSFVRFKKKIIRPEGPAKKIFLLLCIK